MDKSSAKKLKEYLGSPSWTKWLTLALLLVTIISFFVGISISTKDVDPSTAIEFYPAEEQMKHKYVYLNLTGVTDAIAVRENEKWYAAVDPEGYGYIVQLDLAQFASLKAHNDWWYSEEEYDIAPTRIYGMANKMSNELADVVADVFEYSSRDEVFNIFGDYYLDCTESPNEGPSGFVFFLSVLSLIAFVILLISRSSKNSTLKRCIKRLDQLGLTSAAADQMDSPLNDIYGEDVTRISQDFVFSKSLGSVVAISDILWLYGHVQRYNGVVTAQTLRAGTKALKELPICQTKGGKNGFGTEVFDSIMQSLYTRKPDIMLGYSLENLRTYNNMYKEEKQRLKSGV